MRLRTPLSDLDFIDNLFDTLNARLDGIDRRLEKLEAGQADLRTNQMNLIDLTARQEGYHQTRSVPKLDRGIFSVKSGLRGGPSVRLGSSFEVKWHP